MNNKIEFKEFKLSEVCNINYGTRIVKDKSIRGNFPVYGGGGKTFTTNTYNRENCLIISRFALSKNCVRFVKDKFFLNDSGLSLEINFNNLHIDYLNYYLKSLQNQIFSLSRGVGQKNLEMTKFKNKIIIPIPINDDQTPNINYQKKVVKELEKIETAIEKKKKAIELNKEYLESLFYDMFGSPIKNEKGWKIEELKEVCKINRESIIPENIINNTKYVGLEYIEKETGLIKNYELINLGDLKSNKFQFDETMLLYGKLRPYLNKIALPNFSGICSTDILPLKPLKDITNRIYLTYLLRIDYYIKLATIKSTGANLPRLSPSTLSKFKIPVPPITLQNKFAKEVEKYEKIREKQQTSLDKLNDLFNSTMQRAFRGEL